MALDDVVAVLFRYGLTVVYIGIMIFFVRGYMKSKAAGLPNKFFLGFSIMFLAILGIIASTAIYETARLMFPGTASLSTPFPGYDDPAKQAQVGIFLNFCRPLFVLAFLACNVMFAGQVYPLELAINWKKTPVTKLLLISGLATFFIFIPEITYTIITPILIVACIGSLVFGFFLNVGVNVHLFRISTGQIRRRSLFIILAFICFYLGFIWALEVGWTKEFIPFATLKYDIVFGSIMQMVAALFYWIGFRQE
ncbi:MAG: hypothetical protein GYA24_13985 [Candidatus Lokiarchaeota archaeon]|nr:hypothetical protein [Candidatus Lokiarchaeota archaeon]